MTEYTEYFNIPLIPDFAKESVNPYRDDWNTAMDILDYNVQLDIDYRADIDSISGYVATDAAGDFISSTQPNYAPEMFESSPKSGVLYPLQMNASTLTLVSLFVGHTIFVPFDYPFKTSDQSFNLAIRPDDLSLVYKMAMYINDNGTLKRVGQEATGTVDSGYVKFNVDNIEINTSGDMLRAFSGYIGIAAVDQLVTVVFAGSPINSVKNIGYSSSFEPYTHLDRSISSLPESWGPALSDYAGGAVPTIFVFS